MFQEPSLWNRNIKRSNSPTVQVLGKEGSPSSVRPPLDPSCKAISSHKIQENLFFFWVAKTVTKQMLYEWSHPSKNSSALYFRRIKTVFWSLSPMATTLIQSSLTDFACVVLFFDNRVCHLLSMIHIMYFGQWSFHLFPFLELLWWIFYVCTLLFATCFFRIKWPDN
jgi:hypothetical protein